MRTMINGLDLSQRLVSATWSGSIKQCCRQLAVSLAVSPADPRLSAPDVPVWAPVQAGEGERQLFSGKVVYRRRDGEGTALDLRCLDYGLYLTNNQGWYSFRCTPEQAARQICADFGLTPGKLAATGVTLQRKFTGTALHQILYTMYAKAGEQTGRRYVIRVEGKTVNVEEKPLDSSIVLAPRVNLRTSSVIEDATGCCNSVAIYSEAGEPLRTLGGRDEVAGLLQRAVIQRDKGQAEAQAKAILEDGVVEQTVAVEVTGNPALVAGQAVVVRETSARVSGLFWIDADTHTWKGGDYVTKLDLNFRNLMSDENAGN